MEFAKQACQFQNTFWENNGGTEEPVITSVYWVREVMHTWYCLSYFSNHPVMDQRKYTISILSYKDSGCLAPLESIYPVMVCLCFDYDKQEQCEI